MKITKKYLEKVDACEGGIDWFLAQKERDGRAVVEKLIAEDRLDWANWILSRLLLDDDKIRYAVYAAKQALPIFEDKYPDDKRPRNAINAAIAYLKNPTEKNKKAADAARAARAAHAVYAIYAAMMEKKILTYGIKLLGAK